MEKDAKTYWDESAEDFQHRVAGHGWNLEKETVQIGRASCRERV